ncbi:MAG: DUF5615 family PIN-like protein [Chloroflexi bacterium]|nr:DUF5615 family PIN-like protein [Chloroflexota bacterium]
MPARYRFLCDEDYQDIELRRQLLELPVTESVVFLQDVLARGSTDETIVQYAAEHGYVVITKNRRHFKSPSGPAYRLARTGVIAASPWARPQHIVRFLQGPDSESCVANIVRITPQGYSVVFFDGRMIAEARFERQ